MINDFVLIMSSVKIIDYILHFTLPYIQNIHCMRIISGIRHVCTRCVYKGLLLVVEKKI